MLRLRIEEIADQYSRENFRRVQEQVNLLQPLLRGQWRFFSYSFPAALTNVKVKHGLSFVPKDIIQTSVIGAGIVTFNFASFDETFVDVTTTGEVTVRGFIGSYVEGSDA